MYNPYIKNDGKVSGAKIVSDIETGKLLRLDLEKLFCDEKIASAFTTRKFEEKPASEVSAMTLEQAKNYQEHIAASFPSGYFSPEYLFHLADVSERVRILRQETVTKRKWILIGGVAVVLLVAVVLIVVGNSR